MSDGEDPRPRLAYDRTLLANERTLAAWIRTGLTVAAVGLAAGQLVPEARGHRRYVAMLGVLLVIAGIGIMAFGAWRFAAVDRDLAGEGSRAARAAPTAIYALTALVALLLAGLLLAL